jgi:hypothetical protein
MTILNVEKIGLVADYSERGDWAFDLAFSLTKIRNLHLNIFHFLESPYDVPIDIIPSDIPMKEYDGNEIVSLDRKLREYYDGKLGDYVDVGFRVCENARHNFELKRCLREREYHILVIPHIRKSVNFGNMPIEEFAYRFNAPVILVGPTRPDEYRINPAAKMLIDSLVLPLETPESIIKPSRFQELAVI